MLLQPVPDGGASHSALASVGGAESGLVASGSVTSAVRNMLAVTAIRTVARGGSYLAVMVKYGSAIGQIQGCCIGDTEVVSPLTADVPDVTLDTTTLVKLDGKEKLNLAPVTAEGPLFFTVTVNS
jgi:hypothetical protein